MPSFDQSSAAEVLVFSDFKKFRSDSYCRHGISFPEGATFGDIIQINVTNLNRTEVTIATAKNWDKSSKLIG